MIIYRSPNLAIYDPNQISVWSDGKTRVTPLTWNQGSIWARNERDGTKLNYSEKVFNANFRPEGYIENPQDFN